jgi:hypothetical protein
LCNHIARLQSDMERIQSVRNAQQVKNDQLFKTALDKGLSLGHIKMSIQNIYSSVVVNGKKTDDPNVQLEEIQRFLLDMGEIVTEL